MRHVGRTRVAKRSCILGALAVLTVFLIAACSATPETAQIPEKIDEVSQALGTLNVLTRNMDNQRTGANLFETSLNTSNVNASGFGKLFQLAVDDQIFAQVLYASSVTIAGGTHN